MANVVRRRSIHFALSLVGGGGVRRGTEAATA
jgi:hypothetical protein